jgi:hypothetical protein
MDNWTPPILKHYRPLRDVLQNNASQPTAQPVAAPLEEIVDFLSTTRTEELSTLQMGVLQHLGVEHLLGRKGAYWLKRTVKSSNYDPATTFEEVNKAVQTLENAQNNLKTFVSSVGPLGFNLEHLSQPANSFRVAVMFQEDASIESMPDLKKSSADWEQIVSGIAGAVGEHSEDTKIIGVSNGSILVILGTTAAVIKVLAVIAKHASEIASYAIRVADQLEDLRAKKMHNATVEKELRDMEKDRREVSSKEALTEVEDHLPKKITAEQRTKLENSIKKYLTFRDKGGDLDFSMPARVNEADESFDQDLDTLISEACELIEGAQQAKQGVLLLEKKQADQREDKD